MAVPSAARRRLDQRQTRGYSRGFVTETDAEDRRQHERYRLGIPAYLHVAPDVPVCAVRTTNISAGGFRCLTDAVLELGWVVYARLQLNPHEALTCRAQVIRVEEPADRPHGKWLIVAFRFVDLGEARERQLMAALKALGGDIDPTDGPKAVTTRPHTAR